MERRLKQFALSLPAAIFIGLSPVLHAYPPKPDLATALAPPDFSTYDKNGDGFVTIDELGPGRIAPRAFAGADENEDGRLDANEFTKAIAIDDRIRTGKYVDDAWITTKVKALLVKDTGLQGLDIGVETHKGIVKLSGAVDSPEKVGLAEHIASSVEGVIHVQNSLLVKK